MHNRGPSLGFYLRTTAESERNAPTATSAGERQIQAWFRSNLIEVDTRRKPPSLFVAVAAPVTPVAVEIHVDARAQRLAKHFQVAAQRGSGDPLRTRG